MLEEIELANNGIVLLPAALQDLPGLRVLNLGQNRLQKFKMPKGTITHMNLAGEHVHPNIILSSPGHMGSPLVMFHEHNKPPLGLQNLAPWTSRITVARSCVD